MTSSLCRNGERFDLFLKEIQKFLEILIFIFFNLETDTNFTLYLRQAQVERLRQPITTSFLTISMTNGKLIALQFGRTNKPICIIIGRGALNERNSLNQLQKFILISNTFSERFVRRLLYNTQQNCASWFPTTCIKNRTTICKTVSTSCEVERF